LWFSNRRKYHNLKHAIPANVVKSYLDSIIQNSTSLKSSLFRGGGTDINGIPSVMPLAHLSGGDSLGLSGAPSTALMEEINQKKALISSLEAQISSYLASQKEIENKLISYQSNLSSAENKVKELEGILAESSSGGDASLKSELATLKKERDEIKEKLKEFEIISDDLANLKRLHQENDQLKRSLAAIQGASSSESLPTIETSKSDQADVSELLGDVGKPSEAGNENNEALDSFLASSTDEPTSAGQADASALAAMTESEGQTDSKSDKTPEDLLSEFEKMLG
jgi:chromosome segregation ATPase